MKKILFLAFSLSFLVFACKNKQKNGGYTAEELKPTATAFPVMKIDSPFVDLGTVTEGDTVFHTYKFTNTGNIPLVLTNVSASCGCTTPSYSTDPVAPGEEGFISVKFNSRNKIGKLNKTVTAYANTKPSDITLGFKIEVLENKKKPF